MILYLTERDSLRRFDRARPSNELGLIMQLYGEFVVGVGLLQVRIAMGLDHLNLDRFVRRNGHLIVYSDIDGSLLAIGDNVEAMGSLYNRGSEDEPLRLLELLHGLVLNTHARVHTEKNFKFLLRIDNLVDAGLRSDKIFIHKDSQSAREQSVGARVLGLATQVGRRGQPRHGV
jgi:hypothetical protein